LVELLQTAVAAAITKIVDFICWYKIWRKWCLGFN